MRIYYRISDNGYKKVKPDYINNENCLKNFVSVFSKCVDSIYVIADNVSVETYNMITKYVSVTNIERVSVGHGAGTFNLALDKSLTLDDEEIVYFVENDYLHRQDSDKVLLEAFTISIADYATLYDHPDKYMEPKFGGNPLCQGKSELTRLYLTHSCHWKITNSTTMTFASKVKTLKRDEHILRKWTSGTHPDDFKMFLELREQNKVLVSSVPSYSTHGETQWLSPLINWRDYVYP